MLARSREISLAGVSTTTPILIPSISSKGFPPIRLDEEDVRASSFYSELLAGWARRSLLISAFDVHHGLLADLHTMRDNFAVSQYANAGLLFVDSGLYEARPGSDEAEIYYALEEQRDWSQDLLGDTLRSLPPEAHIVVVNWDDYADYESQIATAHAFAEAHSATATRSVVCLLKPEPPHAFHRFGTLERCVDQLSEFDVIGVTEKELGATLAERFTSIATLRGMLDDEGVNAPIHVFGGLDPVLSPLYFAAGAEIFDGLSWLRYAYYHGLSVSREAALAATGDIEETLGRGLLRTQIRNLRVLETLELQMTSLAETEQWSNFDQGDVLAQVAATMFREEAK